MLILFLSFLDIPGDFIFNNKLSCGSSTSQLLPIESHHRWRCLSDIKSDTFLVIECLDCVGQVFLNVPHDSQFSYIAIQVLAIITMNIRFMWSRQMQLNS